jgi:acetyl esterase
MINPELQPFLDEWSRQWAELPQPAGPAQRRAHFERIALRMRQPTPEGLRTDEEFHIEVAGGQRKVRVRVFRPTSDKRRPALVYMHGGAWMQGSPETHWDVTSRIAAANDQVVISVDYSLSPEHPFPAALHDCEAVVRWASGVGAERLNLDRDAIAVGGDSAGANLAAALTLLFRGSAIRLKAQLLVYPGVEFRLDRPSHLENANGPIISVASMPAVDAAYCPNPDDMRNPLAAPLLADSHAGLPPAFIAVAQHDPLRDGGRAYAQALRDAGVPVKLDEGPGLIHGYLRAMAYCADSRRAFDRMCEWLRKALAA